MDTAVFDPSGGPLVVRISSGFAHPGSYTLLLWSGSDIVLERSGSLAGDAPREQLDPPPAEQDGRIVEALVTLVITPPIDQYDVRLLVEQDGRTLGSADDSGTGASGSVTADLYLRLAAGGTP